MSQNAIEAFEEAAEAFDKATGFMMPGKDVPAAAYVGEEHEAQRRAHHKTWRAAIEFMHRPGGLLVATIAERDDWKRRYVENVKLTGESAAVLIRERDEARDIVAILLLDHQRVEPHHSDLCDKCRLAKTAISAAIAKAEAGS